MGWDELQTEHDLADAPAPVWYAAPNPGEKCPTCTRKVPHERKPSSPKSRVKSVRIPVDEYDAFVEVLDEVERYLAVYGLPFSSFKALAVSLGLVLQNDSLRGYGQKNWTGS